jgi:hypothetical protein
MMHQELILVDVCFIRLDVFIMNLNQIFYNLVDETLKLYFTLIIHDQRPVPPNREFMEVSLFFSNKIPGYNSKMFLAFNLAFLTKSVPKPSSIAVSSMSKHSRDHHLNLTSQI